MCGEMMKRLVLLLWLLASIATLAGCAGILEGDEMIESQHLAIQTETRPEERIEVSDYDELLAEIINFVMQHDDSGRVYAYIYHGHVEADIQRACSEIKSINPICAYAVSEIEGIAMRIVSYYEIDINIKYNRTKQQVDSIANVSTLRYLRTELLNVMSEYKDEAVFHTTLNVTKEEIAEYVDEIYYENPRKIVMKPIVVVEVFPDSGEDKVFELRFGYIERASILSQYGENLSLFTRRNAERAVGENDAEILLSLVENLVAACTYDEGMAKAISVYGAQNFAATAYGALENGNAVGEGFAMAFKALCDELSFDCRVVLGYRNNIVHAWNIVLLNGDYYHIDVAMCAANGIQTAFLKTDAYIFANRYAWDMANTVNCRGTMTYEDIAGKEEETDENGDDSDVDVTDVDTEEISDEPIEEQTDDTVLGYP